MKKETINILIQSKGRMAPQVEKVFKKNKLKIIKANERSLVGFIKGYPSVKILYMNTEMDAYLTRVTGEIPQDGQLFG